MDRQYTLSAFLLLASLPTSSAFVHIGQQHRAPVLNSPLRSPGPHSLTGAFTCLWMSEGSEAVDPELADLKERVEELESTLKSAEELANQGEETEAADSAEGSGEEGDEQKEEEPKEDPEIVALKEEIAALESTLKTKRGTLSYTEDQIDQYSKAGYARKVAEMENMRRMRSSMNSSSRSSATAGVLADFLPVYDKMNQLKEKYANDDFGSKYGGLAVDTAFAKMGVKSYTVEVGEAVDSLRMTVVDSEHSNDFDKDTVIRPVALGLDLEGNVVRAAECVASLGAEEKEQDSQPDEAEETGTD